MKIKHLIALLMLVLLIAACGGNEEATPATPTETALQEVEPEAAATATELPPTEPAPAETPAVEESIVAGMEHVADAQLIDILWQWERRTDNGGAQTIINVPNPGNYTLLFDSDGTFRATLDCNDGSGRYATPRPGGIFMELGEVTEAVCQAGSLDKEMANIFGPAQDYEFAEEGQVLIFKWVAGGPNDYFRNAAAAAPEAAAETPGEAEVQAIPPDAIQMSTQGVADSYEWSVQPGVEPAPGPGGGGMPPHILLTFDGATAEELLADNGPRLYIFPTEAYINLYQAQGNTIVADQVARLETLIATASSRQELPEGTMPLLPPPNSFMDRWVQFLDLDFEVGQGVRYVSDSPSRQAIGPWTNETTGYYYQGLTSDGIFYVSLFWPEATESLPNTTADVPADVMAVATNPDTYPDYLQATKDSLNALPAAAWTPDLSSLDAMMASLTFPTGPAGNLTGQTWQWQSLSDPAAGETVVDDPARYTILFNEDGTAAIQADCNSVQAAYTSDGSALSITLGPSTLAACPAGSLDQQYLAALENAALYFFEAGDLYIDQMFDSGTLRLAAAAAGGEAPEAESGDGTATGTVTAPDGVFIRTGPGSEYPDVGAIAFDETVAIVGISEDSAWYQVTTRVTSATPEGLGWVSAGFVSASGTSNLPVVEVAPQAPSLTGTTWRWTSLGGPASILMVDDPLLYTVLFNGDGTAAIRADCNNVLASYTTDGDAITITLGAATLAACAEDSLDQDYLAALEAATSYALDGGGLSLNLPESRVMAFAAGASTAAPGPTATPPPSTATAPTATPDASSPSSAVGIPFQVASFGPSGAPEALLPGTAITALFSETEVTGSAGCNDYTGSLLPVADYFTVALLPSTVQRTCDEPAGIMEQEQAYLAALASLTGFRWQQEVVDGTTVITAGQLFYSLADVADGAINLVSVR